VRGTGESGWEGLGGNRVAVLCAGWDVTGLARNKNAEAGRSAGSASCVRAIIALLLLGRLLGRGNDGMLARATGTLKPVALF
jgi:hypothetical protein